ncbi:DUF1045 domain-containing protein [Shimia ponticola]|uniref:DUF1045 domain-containing protein n=1 Tax=Shimia ponticola TaxID=2582893 RepID=UPI0011BF99C9|nr:DUF1045 domain-containing protein [Shimia ponticola]
MSYSRFAIYYVAPEGTLAEFGASWLGWDIARGCVVPLMDHPGLAAITEAPRKYGFHGTLKPPFRLADGASEDGLHTALSDMARMLPPARCDGLELRVLGGFLALTPRGDLRPLQQVAETCVIALDRFRAPLTDAELARRRKANLSDRQEALLRDWGYPYVMDQFRFHLTLSGKIAKADMPAWTKTARDALPDLPRPFVIDQVALCGERCDGRFEVIHRYPLTG